MDRVCLAWPSDAYALPSDEVTSLGHKSTYAFAIYTAVRFDLRRVGYQSRSFDA